MIVDRDRREDRAVIGGGKLSLAWGLLLPLLACTTAVNTNPYQPPSTTGAAGASGHTPSGDVTVSIDLPVATPTPRYGRGSLIEVSAHVDIVGGTDFVDSTSVKATVTHQNGNEIVENGQLSLSKGDAYAGRVSLGDLASGPYTLTVMAASSGGVTKASSVDFQIDAGPIVVINSPVANKSYKHGLTIEVVATDTFGLAGAPTAVVGDITVVLAPAGVDNTYRGMIDFDIPKRPDGTVETTLTGDQLLTVVATNLNGTRTELQIIFAIDNEGPIITKTNPTPGQIVGGIVEISATITDNAGVLDASVIAVISDDTDTTKTPLFELALKPQGGGVYSALFDSAQLTPCRAPPVTSLCLVFPTISFRASDVLSNETVVGYGFSIDNVPPVADLDPPNLRDMKFDPILRCSHEFDPLGNDDFNGDMPNDTKMVPQVFDLRARIEDDGNRAAGLKLSPLSLVDPNGTSVYVLDDETLPLIVDTDGDGTCDSINPILIPTTEPPTNNNQVLKVRLAPVPSQGGGDFTPDSTLPLPYCASGQDQGPPAPICTFFQPTVAISYAFGEPAIWSVEPVDKIHCEGNQFDALANNIHEGWACIAVGTTDKVGNFSVSAPLRVYIKYDYDLVARPLLLNRFGADPPAGAGPPPTCTGLYDKTTKMVTAGACATRKFKRDVSTGADYTCYLGDCQGPLP